MSAPELSFVTTNDGSSTLFHPIIGENYHSIHGAHQETLHVFVNSGLDYYHKLHLASSISILEIGFGTGLNFLLTAEHAIQHQLNINYTGIEAFPLPKSIIGNTMYHQYLRTEGLWNNFLDKYEGAFQQTQSISNLVKLEIIENELLNFNTDKKFDIIYFDAFAKSHQPSMWTEESIAKACSFLKDKGIFVTYSVTGDLKRALKSLGFTIERPQGAAGKREMMRATLIEQNDL